MSLVSGWFPALTVALAVFGLLAGVPWEQEARWRVLGRSAVATAVVTAAVVGVVDLAGWLPWPVPWTFDLSTATVFLAAALGIVAWRYVRWRRLVAVSATLATALMTATLVNATYQYFPTAASLLDPLPGQPSLAAVTVQRHLRHGLPTGVVVSVAIPATRSHFAARPAYVWVPPAYTADPSVSLPVIELLAGSPGTPLDWIRGGAADITADAYAARHDGVAPLIVMPDDNGSLTGDTECVNGPDGAAETYLTVDVPSYMRAVFHAASGPRTLAVAGLSEGGTCAVMLALRHHVEYAAFGDYSGLAAPSSVDVVSPHRTVRALFHGSVAQYDQHDPVLLLHDAHFTGLAGWFEVGGGDRLSETAQDTLGALSRQAGVQTVTVVVPRAGHDFRLWSQSFGQSLPFLAQACSSGLVT